MTLNPIYDPNPAGWAQLKVRTYRAEITITATTKKFDKISGTMEVGADAGVSSMSTPGRDDVEQLLLPPGRE